MRDDLIRANVEFQCDDETRKPTQRVKESEAKDMHRTSNKEMPCSFALQSFSFFFLFQYYYMNLFFFCVRARASMAFLIVDYNIIYIFFRSFSSSSLL